MPVYQRQFDLLLVVSNVCTCSNLVLVESLGSELEYFELVSYVHQSTFCFDVYWSVKTGMYVKHVVLHYAYMSVFEVEIELVCVVDVDSSESNNVNPHRCNIMVLDYFHHHQLLLYFHLHYHPHLLVASDESVLMS